MRWFFGVVGVLAWIWALAVLWIFSESGGALTVIAAGIFAIVAVLALGCERILKTLEQIRDGVPGVIPPVGRTAREREIASETRHVPAV
ncbi:MAG: hypothetical protein ACREV5_04245 [Steroidobacter sp.]